MEEDLGAAADMMDLLGEQVEADALAEAAAFFAQVHYGLPADPIPPQGWQNVPLFPPPPIIPEPNNVANQHEAQELNEYYTQVRDVWWPLFLRHAPIIKALQAINTIIALRKFPIQLSVYDFLNVSVNHWYDHESVVGQITNLQRSKYWSYAANVQNLIANTSADGMPQNYSVRCCPREWTVWVMSRRPVPPTCRLVRTFNLIDLRAGKGVQTSDHVSSRHTPSFPPVPPVPSSLPPTNLFPFISSTAPGCTPALPAPAARHPAGNVRPAQAPIQPCQGPRYRPPHQQGQRRRRLQCASGCRPPL